MRIRQIVLAVQDLARGRALLGPLLQLAPPYRDPGVAEFGIDNAVFTFGDQFIELVSPTRPDSACARHLARHGDGGYMLILQTDSLARERARLEALGVRRVWQAEFDDIAAMHLHPKDIGGAIVSLDEPRPAAAWRWGGPDWRVAPGDAGRQRVLGLTLRSGAPEALARRWAQVLDRPAPLRQGDGWRVLLDEGVVDVQPSADGLEALSGFTLAVADVGGVCARAAAAGLVVSPSAAGAQLALLGAACTLQPLSALAPAAG